MKISKTTVFSAALAILACAATAQQAATPAAQKTEAAEAATQNEDRSYLADYEGKAASVTLFDEKTKSESVAAFKSATDSDIVFVGGGGDIAVSKKKPSSLKVVVKPDNNWLRIRSAIGRENWDEAIVYMRPFVYPLIPLMSINHETFKGNSYLEMYLNALVNANRMKEAVSIVDALKLGEVAPSLVSSALNVAEALAKSGDKKGALAILEHIPFSGDYTAVIPDMLSVLSELRNRGAVQECGVLYTKLTGVDSPQKNEATLWMVYCDLSMGKKMSAEIYLNQFRLTQNRPNFRFLKWRRACSPPRRTSPTTTRFSTHTPRASCSALSQALGCPNCSTTRAWRTRKSANSSPQTKFSPK